MNRERRKSLANAHDLLVRAYRIIEMVDNQELEAILNVPPNLLDGKGSVTGVDRNRQLGDELAALKRVMTTVKDIADGK